MNKIYGLLNKLDEIVSQKNDINNSNFALSIRRQIEKSNLDWRQELTQDEMLIKIENSQQKSLEVFESAYQAYNIGVASLISKDIKEFSEAKTELAGLRERKTGLETQLSDYDVFLAQHDMAVGIQEDIAHVFNTMLETIESHLGKALKIFPFDNDLETPKEWLEATQTYYDLLFSMFLDAILGSALKMNLNFSYNDIEEKLNEELKDTSKDNEIELFKMIDIIFPEDDKFNKMMDGTTELDLEYVIEALIAYFIDKAIEQVIPIYSQISLAVSLIKILLLIQTAMFSNLFENMNFLRNYTLETIPKTKSLIQEKYNESSFLKGAQVVNKLINFKGIMNEATSKVLGVLKPLPISLVRDLVGAYVLDENLKLNWVSTAFTLTFAIKEPIEIIKSLRDEITEMPSDISEKHIEINGKKIESEKNLKETILRIAFLENLLKNSQYDKLTKEMRELDSKLVKYNDILNWSELKNYFKNNAEIDTVKNLKENQKTLQWNELYRNNILGKYLFLYVDNTTQNKELKNLNDRYREIYYILDKSLKEVVENEDATYNLIYN